MPVETTHSPATMIVCNDADLWRAAGGGIWAGFSNCGQFCGGVERVFNGQAFCQNLQEMKNGVEGHPEPGYPFRIAGFALPDCIRRRWFPGQSLPPLPHWSRRFSIWPFDLFSVRKRTMIRKKRLLKHTVSSVFRGITPHTGGNNPWVLLTKPK